MNVLVTGGAGFIGRRLVDRLSELNRVVVVDSLDEQVHGSIAQFDPSLERIAQCTRASVTDSNVLQPLLYEADVVIHLAAQTGTSQSMYSIADYVRQNVYGTANLLESIQQTGLRKRVVLASSRAVYGDGVYHAHDGLHAAQRQIEDLRAGVWDVVDNEGSPVLPLPMSETHPLKPVSVYGLTKLWQEQLVRMFCETHDLECYILRFQNVYGPGQALANQYTGVLGYFTSCILRDREIDLFEDGLMTRDFIFVDDCVAAIDAVVRDTDSKGGTYNVGSGVSRTLADVIEVTAHALKRAPRVRKSGYFRRGDVRHACADISKFVATFGVESTTSFEDGIHQFVEWAKTQPAFDFDLWQQTLVEADESGILGICR